MTIASELNLNQAHRINLTLILCLCTSIVIPSCRENHLFRNIYKLRHNLRHFNISVKQSLRKNISLSVGNASASSEENHFLWGLQTVPFPQESSCFSSALVEVIELTVLQITDNRITA